MIHPQRKEKASGYQLDLQTIPHPSVKVLEEDQHLRKWQYQESFFKARRSDPT